MACARCKSPRSVCVCSYNRAGPPKKRARKPSVAKPQAAYWTCENDRTGRTCGTKHHTHGAAVAHRKKLDLASYRAGNGRPWNVEKRA